MLNEDNDRLPTVCFALRIIYVSIGTCGRAHIGASRRYVQMRSLLRHANEAKLLRNSSRFSNVPTWNLCGGGGGMKKTAKFFMVSVR